MLMMIYGYTKIMYLTLLTPHVAPSGAKPGSVSSGDSPNSNNATRHWVYRFAP